MGLMRLLPRPNTRAPQATEEQTLSLLLASQEYFNRAPSVPGAGRPASNQTFVKALFRQLLNRSASDPDVAFWVGQVAAVGRDGVARAIQATANLTVLEGEADELVTDRGRITGVRLADGREFGTGAVVLTTGTFLRGLIHIGEQTTPAGRVGEAGDAAAG